MTFHAEGGGIMDNLYSDVEESESDGEDIEPVGIQSKSETNKSNLDVASIEEQVMEEEGRRNVDNSDFHKKTGDEDEEDDSERDSDYDDEVSDLDEQIEKQTNEQENARGQALLNIQKSHLLNVETNREMKLQTKPDIINSSDESDEDDDSDLEVIEEDVEDEVEPRKEGQPSKDNLPTETKGESLDIGKQMCKKDTENKKVDNVDKLINSYFDNLLIKREKNSKSPHSPLAQASPGSPDSGVWSPEPSEEKGGDGKEKLRMYNSGKQALTKPEGETKFTAGLEGPLSVSQFQGTPKLVKSKMLLQDKTEESLQKSKIKVDLKSSGVKRAYKRKSAVKSAESREEDSERKEKEPNKKIKCEVCEQSFISKNAFFKHATSIHKADINTNEECKNETVENEEESKKIEASEACRYCKSFFNPVDIGLALCPMRRDQKLDVENEFDADAYFEAFYKASMGDYLFFAEEVDPLSKEDVDILKEGEKDRNATSPLCSECTDDFYWPLNPNQVFSLLMSHLSHFFLFYHTFTLYSCLMKRICFTQFY